MTCSLSINALHACVYIYIWQLSTFRAPMLWFTDLIATCYLPNSIHFSEIMSIFFMRKQTKHENTQSPASSRGKQKEKGKKKKSTNKIILQKDSSIWIYCKHNWGLTQEYKHKRMTVAMSGGNKNVTVQVLSAYICYHGESNQEPKDGHDADKDLFAVSFTQVLGIQVHNGCHKPFDANKL